MVLSLLPTNSYGIVVVGQNLRLTSNENAHYFLSMIQPTIRDSLLYFWVDHLSFPVFSVPLSRAFGIFGSEQKSVLIAEEVLSSVCLSSFHINIDKKIYLMEIINRP